MNLIKFYQDVLTSVGYVYDDDGFILLENTDGKKSMVMANKKPLVLPTKERLQALTAEVDGEMVLQHTLFNPLKEDPVKGESESLKKLKNAVDIRLKWSLAAVFELLIKLGSDLDLQKKGKLSLQTFIGSLNTVRSRNMKHIIDEGTLSRWNNVFDATLKAPSTKGILHVYIKKGGMYGGTKYNRLAVMTTPLYKEILKLGKNTPLHGVKMRPKDVEVFKLIYEYIFDGIEDPEKYMFGSMDPLSPGFASLFKLYIKVGNRLNSLLKDLAFIDEDLAKHATLNIKVKSKTIDNINVFERELAALPSDLDAGRHSRMLVNDQAAKEPAVMGNNETGKTTARSILNNQHSINNSLASYSTPVSKLPVNTNTASPFVNNNNNTNVNVNSNTGMTAAQKILYGNTSIPNGSNVQQRPMGINAMPMQQQPAFGQQPFQGINNVSPFGQQQMFGGGMQQPAFGQRSPFMV